MKLLPYILLFFCFTYTASATPYEAMNQKIKSFSQSGQARFAPVSMKRVEAFQGASMIASEESSGFSGNETEKLDAAIHKTLIALNNARNNAISFKNTFPELLKLETQATKALIYHHKPQMLPDSNVQNLYNAAAKKMNVTITSTEKGDLNLARQAAKEATSLFNQSIDAAMPGLVEQTDKALSQASSVGAEKYAPRTYNAADESFELLEAYADNLIKNQQDREDIQRPEKIGLSLETAVYAQKLAIQVKSWKRDNGSYEKLTLAARHQRLELARTMNIQLDYEKIDVDITAEELIKQVQFLAQSLNNERAQHASELAILRENSDASLNARLQEQRLKDHQAFQNQVSKIKSAFNSKLERETFEKKRQQKVQNLFSKSEADIITNLDQSIIIRAKAIRFSSNSSKVDSKYFDFLGRIKDALDLYPSRNIVLEGHTDSSGKALTNRKLSLSRAESVQEFLIAAGFDASRIKAVGYGEAKPIATNMYEKGRALNRRIDIIIQAP
ncbi:MAG: OmpA family protein [Ghiorsea sp.]